MREKGRAHLFLFGFLASSSTTRLYHGRVPRLTSDNFTSYHTRDRVGRPWLPSQPVTWEEDQNQLNGFPIVLVDNIPFLQRACHIQLSLTNVLQFSKMNLWCTQKITQGDTVLETSMNAEHFLLLVYVSIIFRTIEGLLVSHKILICMTHCTKRC